MTFPLLRFLRLHRRSEDAEKIDAEDPRRRPLTMFLAKGRGNREAKSKETFSENDYGWRLCNEDDPRTPRSSRSKDCLSLDSASESMLSCIDSDFDDDETYSLAQEFRLELADNRETIELASVVHKDLDAGITLRDATAKEPDAPTFPAEEAESYFEESAGPKSHRSRVRGICYTPERLVRSQEYRILTPSPRYLSISQTRLMSENESPRKAPRSRRRLNYLIDSKQVCDGHQKTLVNSSPVEVAMPAVFSEDWTRSRTTSEQYEDASSIKHEKISFDESRAPDLIYKRSSNEGLNVTWEDCKRIETRSSSMDDTSGIQSNDWSSDTHSDLQSTPLCLSVELASTNYKLDTSQGRCTAINEAVSILEVLDTDPEKAVVLLEEDRFCDSTSSHDRLTRLALAIETDAKDPDVLETSENVVRDLQRRVEMLQASNKDMFRDICNLRQSFQCDERKMDDISSSTSKLRQEVCDMRYLDDLLNLLSGKLKRISDRDWPFAVGRFENQTEETNLIV
nr:uncharacterized protein LOC117221665 isoform X1 [Megalopta genalis]